MITNGAIGKGSTTSPIQRGTANISVRLDTNIFAKFSLRGKTPLIHLLVAVFIDNFVNYSLIDEVTLEHV